MCVHSRIQSQKGCSSTQRRRILLCERGRAELEETSPQACPLQALSPSSVCLRLCLQSLFAGCLPSLYLRLCLQSAVLPWDLPSHTSTVSRKTNLSSAGNLMTVHCLEQKKCTGKLKKHTLLKSLFLRDSQ